MPQETDCRDPKSSSRRLGIRLLLVPKCPRGGVQNWPSQTQVVDTSAKSALGHFRVVLGTVSRVLRLSCPDPSLQTNHNPSTDKETPRAHAYKIHRLLDRSREVKMEVQGHGTHNYWD